MENVKMNDEVKTQFVTREGCYRLLNLSEYSRSNRVGYQSNQNSPQVRVSFVSLPQNPSQVLQQQQSVEKGSSSVINTNNNLNSNGNNINASSSSNGPIPSNSLSSATTATVTSLTNGLQHQQEHTYLNQNNVPNGDWICFNFGKELYTYSYRGVKKAADLSKPIDKKLYKGTNPSCHDFNQTSATFEGAPLLVGFTTGQIQLVYPGRRETGKLYNEERLIDKTKVTCLKWLPNSSSLFLAAHASGHLYLYDGELPCCPAAPVYQPFKNGDGYSILTCKSKSTRNPLYKWSFGVNSAAAPNGNNSSSSSSSSSSTISSSSSSYSCASDNCSINEFCFSPDGANLAIVSQDGFLRIFLYDTMELVGIARSYFGGFLCVCWSPDGKYIVVGGEDDLVTVYSFSERRVVARGHGHRSWVSVVAFDPYTTFSSWDTNDFSDDENQYEVSSNSKRVRSSSIRDSTLAPDKLICYRLGSVSQDTQLCLWDITEDVLRPHQRVRLSTLDPTQQKTETVQMNGDCSVGAAGAGDRPSPTLIVKDTIDSSLSNSHTTKLTGSTKLINCVSGDGGITVESGGSVSKKGKSTSLASVVGNSSNSNLSATKTSTNDDKSNNHSAFNTLTQRFTNFSFGSDKSSKGNKRNFNSTGKGNGNHSVDQKNGQNCDGNSASSTLRNKSNGSIVTYDAMKLIGTPACPRYDDCPVLEPLICKKIAHERLTALIFREDAFVTACQDGFVYTWARPNSSHLATNSPTIPHSSTIV